MRIAIIGTGAVGSAIARGLAGTDHAVTLGSRQPQEARVAALAAETGAAAALPAAAAADADLVVLALPWAGLDAAVRTLGDLSGKVVVDCTNPLGRGPEGLTLTIGHTTSGGETVQAWLPGARVVKTLNQVGAEMIAANAHLPHRPAMFLAGNDAAARADAAALVTALGFEALDAGDLTKARLLEPLGMVWINQALFRGKGRLWALAALD